MQRSTNKEDHEKKKGNKERSYKIEKCKTNIKRKGRKDRANSGLEINIFRVGYMVLY